MGFRSTEGEGSTFAFYVKTERVQPLVQSPPILEPRELAKLSLVAETYLPMAIAPTKTATSRVNVLLVEDNLVNQKVYVHHSLDMKAKKILRLPSPSSKVTDNSTTTSLCKQLEKHNFKVSIANHGEEALDHLRTTNHWTANAPHTQGEELSFILMDVEMPIMDGMTCVSRIRQLQRDGALSTHIPVIAITANARGQQIQEAMKAGMDEVITKPFRMPELMSLLTRLIGAQGMPAQLSS